MKRIFIACLILSLSLSVNSDIFQKNKSLGRGINLGNTFEAPSFGAWGEKYDTSYIRIIAEKGFQTIRMPIRWSNKERTAVDSPFTINDTFFLKVDEAIKCALNYKLNVIINVHHYDSLFQNPTKEWNRFKAIWTQVASRYKDYSDSLFFEVLNEPNTNLTPEKWNTLLSETFPIIRENNKTRPVIIGVAEWGGINALKKLVLPSDSNIILTVHYYLPFNFTHQGASWVDGSEKWIGLQWKGTNFEKKAVIDDIEYIRSYSVEKKVPVFIGEFGTIVGADMASRARWSSYCARLYEKYDFSWAYWAFGAGFDIYSKAGKKWLDTLSDALLSTDTSILAMSKDTLGTDIIKNGNFTDTLNWKLQLNGPKAEAKGSVANNEYKVEITNPDSLNWHIQLIQEGVILKKNHSYVLTFDVSADSDRVVSVSVDRCPPPDYKWTSYATKWGIVVDKAKKTVSVPFTMAVDDSIGRVTFFLGVEKPTVHFSNVHLYDQGSTISVKHQLLASGKTLIPFTTKMNKQSIVVAFGNNMPTPVSILLCNVKGQIVYKADNVTIGKTNSIVIPFQNRSSSPVILQVKSAALSSCSLLNSVN